jgi:YVTN family beta-propeller protein
MRNLIWLAGGLVAAVAAFAGPAGAGQNVAYAVVGRIPGPDGGWDYASFDARLHRLFVSRTDGVLAVDVNTGNVTPTLVPGARVHSSLPLPDGQLLVTNGTANTVVLADEKTGQINATIPAGQNPDGAVFDQASGLAFVMDGRSGDITIIDPKARTAIGTIAVGGKLEGAVVDGRGKLFVNVEDSGEIAVVDLQHRGVADRYKLTGCTAPSGLAYIPAHHLLLSACENQKAMVLDANKGTIVAQLTIGPRPDFALYDAKRKVAFIPSGGDGTLAVIRIAGRQDISVIQTVPTQLGARTAAEDPKTGRIYLPVATYERSADGGKPQIQSHSFAIVVVGPQAKD